MDTYIYKADLYCADCGEKIKESIKQEYFVGTERCSIDTSDSDNYPKGPYPDGGGESDSPQHCSKCGCFLENPLTSDGYSYVQELLQDSIRDSLAEWMSYYSFSIESSESY